MYVYIQKRPQNQDDDLLSENTDPVDRCWHDDIMQQLHIKKVYADFIMNLYDRFVLRINSLWEDFDSVQYVYNIHILLLVLSLLLL